MERKHWNSFWDGFVRVSRKEGNLGQAFQKREGPGMHVQGRGKYLILIECWVHAEEPNIRSGIDTEVRLIQMTK